MPGTTPIYGLTYPVSADRLDDAVTTIPQQLAEDVESTIAGFGGIASPGSWTAPTLGAGWVNYGGGYQSVEYRKVGQALYLRGLITRTGTSGSGALFTLPSGFRPILPTQYGVILGTPAAAVIEVSAAGVVTVFQTVGVSTVLPVTSPPIWLD